MPAGTTALSKVAANPPAGGSFNEQASDVAPGNKFPATAGKTRLYARNTTLAQINLIFEADKHGAERTLLVVPVPGSGTENGVKVAGPFDAELLDHSATELASNGNVFVRQDGGVDGDVVLCPFD